MISEVSSCCLCALDASHLFPQGYLFVSVLLTEASEYAKLVQQAIKNDLASRLELNVCLALNCVANIGGKDMTAAVAPEIQRLLTAELVSQQESLAPCLGLTCSALFLTSSHFVLPGLLLFTFCMTLSLSCLLLCWSHS